MSDQLHQEPLQQLLVSVTQERARQLTAQIFFAVLDRVAVTTHPISSAIPRFLEQSIHGNLYDYLLHERYGKKIEIEREFLAAMRLDPATLFLQVRACDPATYEEAFQQKTWAQLSLQEQAGLSSHFVREALIEPYQLKISSWHPKDPFHKLIETLKTQGPLMVAGGFGRDFYQSPPTSLSHQVEGRQIYGWSKGAARPQVFSGHVVLLVGAEKTAPHELVYYIDPSDDSDPAHPESQKIYAITYPSLTSSNRIADLHGFLRNDAPRSIGYAYCRA